MPVSGFDPVRGSSVCTRAEKRARRNQTQNDRMPTGAMRALAYVPNDRIATSLESLRSLRLSRPEAELNGASPSLQDVIRIEDRTGAHTEGRGRSHRPYI